MAHILHGNAGREVPGRDLGDNVIPAQVTRARGNGRLPPTLAIRKRHRTPCGLLESIPRSAALCCPVPLLNSLFPAMSTVRLDSASFPLLVEGAPSRHQAKGGALRHRHTTSCEHPLRVAVHHPFPPQSPSAVIATSATPVGRMADLALRNCAYGFHSSRISANPPLGFGKTYLPALSTPSSTNDPTVPASNLTVPPLRLYIPALELAAPTRARSLSLKPVPAQKISSRKLSSITFGAF